MNSELEDTPETVNSDPYHDGGFFRLQPQDAAEVESLLLDAETYQQHCEEDA